MDQERSDSQRWIRRGVTPNGCEGERGHTEVNTTKGRNRQQRGKLQMAVIADEVVLSPPPATVRRKTLRTNLGRTDSSALAGSLPSRYNSDPKHRSFKVGRYVPPWQGDNRVRTHSSITMAVQMTQGRFGVVLMDRSQVRTAPGPQPQRDPPPATDCHSGFPVARGGRSRVIVDSELGLPHWNAERLRKKKTELQNFRKQNGIDACTIQETHLAVNYRFFVREYETYGQEPESRCKCGVVNKNHSLH